MAATAAQVAQVRRMVGESDDTTTYTDVTLKAYIERYPLIDERGEAPYTWDTSTEPPTQDDNDDWIDTYDLNAAAADIWEEKAATLAQDYDFKADGASFSRSQAHEQAMRMARFYRSKRAVGTVTQRPEPQRTVDVLWVGNLAETED